MTEKHRVRLTLEYAGPEPAFLAALNVCERRHSFEDG
jgi:hypothetical protein